MDYLAIIFFFLVVNSAAAAALLVIAAAAFVRFIKNRDGFRERLIIHIFPGLGTLLAAIPILMFAGLGIMRLVLTLLCILSAAMIAVFWLVTVRRIRGKKTETDSESE